MNPCHWQVVSWKKSKSENLLWHALTNIKIICVEITFDCESADGKSEKNLGSNERYIH